MGNFIQSVRAHRKAIYVLIFGLCLASGLIIAYLSYNQSFSMGDDATFFDFAHNISHGEIIYKDFIHFRTPGDYFLEAGFLKVFGDHMNSLELSLHIETLVLVPLLVLAAALLIFRHKKNPLYLLATFAGIALLPPLADLRVGLGILAIACYSLSFELGKHQKRYLLVAGILTGLCFTFGQEIAAMVAVTLIAGELYNKQADLRLWQRLKILGSGIGIGLLPLFLYLVIFSNVFTFLYYVFWYSFVIQPKYMNLPFPGFKYATVIYFLPFVLYWLCFLVLYANRKFGKPAVLFLSFGILQLITELGRSDMGHLLFSIPELFIVLPLYLFSINDSRPSRKTMRGFLPYGLLVILLFLTAKVSHSISIIILPFVMLYAIEHRPEVGVETAARLQQSKLNLSLLFGGSLAIFIFLLAPVYNSTLMGAKGGWESRHDTALKIEGIKADPVTYEEVTQVEAAVSKDHPNTIFSFPIIAFFDTLAPHHGSRNITFEFETTVNQQNQTITDLGKSHPGVVIFDPLQAQGLSSATWKISDYITGHYKIQKQVVVNNIYWVMVPKSHPSRDDKLVYQLYKDNTGPAALMAASGVQDSSKGLNNAVEQTSPLIHFSVDDTKGSHLSVGLTNNQGSATMPAVCGAVIVHYSQVPAQTIKLCSSQGRLTIPLRANKQPLQLDFKNTAGLPIIWNDPEITN